ncbi:MAG TPA: MATE family efflux transporter, partial [Devosia sp.]|nr:MATE family efflux transporter [Devosia sp.]
FFVDAVTLFYISSLNDPAQTAAVGRASYVIGFLIAISVGMMIGSSVLIARSIGADKEDTARRYGGSALAGVALVSALFVGILFFLTDGLLRTLGAQGAALDHARRYLLIILPAMPFMSIGMVSMGILRAWGAARQSMYITLTGGVLTASLDPIFIFVLHMEVTGAAIVSLIARISFAIYGLFLVLRVNRMVRFAPFGQMLADMGEMARLGIPAILTNLGAPVGAFLIAQKISEFGDAALAGQSVVDRLIPLAFGVIFALSGAVGPIIGQNFGAGLIGRTRQTLRDGVLFNGIYVLFAWGALYLGRNAIIAAYSATGDMALMIDLFCSIAAAAFFFNGMLFVTNATFNNLGRPLWATGFNWLRQTVGVVPFIAAGAAWNGLTGIAYGIVAGSIPFALFALAAAFRLISSLTPDSDAATEASG